jgi:hypothetical protein
MVGTAQKGLCAPYGTGAFLPSASGEIRFVKRETH